MINNIISIATGDIKEYGLASNTFLSAYKKDNFYNFIELDCYGLKNDNQVDKKYHGGIDKALHIGSSSHFSLYTEKTAKEADKLSFGCNLLVDNLNEKNVNVGDVYTIGAIEIEISQPRQACWKIAAIFDKHISRFIHKEYATGWYARVINGGTLNINDNMLLKKRVSEVTIYELNEYLITPPNDERIISRILQIKALSQSYKNDLTKACAKKNK